MNLYIASLIGTGEADNLEAFTESLFKAMDGDKDAQKVIHVSTPTIIVCGRVLATESDAEAPE